jgi:hypothetical protein
MERRKTNIARSRERRGIDRPGMLRRLRSTRNLARLNRRAMVTQRLRAWKKPKRIIDGDRRASANRRSDKLNYDPSLDP